jgi:hypothetical protein
LYGWDVPKDRQESVKWYRKAADQGHARAQYELGISYSTGDGVPVDREQAAAFYRKAAEQGLAGAQVCLGSAYTTGRGVSQDNVEAASWYRKAAEQGVAVAQWALGYCYYSGEGVPKDYAEAAKWYQKAAEQGDEVAQYGLAVCFARGEGVETNREEAAKWCRRAAEQGHAAAQCNVGKVYRFGKESQRTIPKRLNGIARQRSEDTAWPNSTSVRCTPLVKVFLETMRKQLGSVNFLTFVWHVLREGASAFPFGGRFADGNYLVFSHGKDLVFTTTTYWLNYLHGILFTIIQLICFVAIWRLSRIRKK